jgi:hypothetical protein
MPSWLPSSMHPNHVWILELMLGWSNPPPTPPTPIMSHNNTYIHTHTHTHTYIHTYIHMRFWYKDVWWENQPATHQWCFFFCSVQLRRVSFWSSEKRLQWTKWFEYHTHLFEWGGLSLDLLLHTNHLHASTYLVAIYLPSAFLTYLPTYLPT